MEKIKYIKNLQVFNEEKEAGILAVKATGIAALKHLISPVLVYTKEYREPSDDGIFELDFVLGSSGVDPLDVEMEVDVVFKFKTLPKWVKGIKVNAEENSDIELI